MKTLLSIGCLAACALLIACGPDSGDTTTIQAKDIRPPAGEPLPPPGSEVKLNSNAGAVPPKTK